MINGVSRNPLKKVSRRTVISVTLFDNTECRKQKCGGNGAKHSLGFRAQSVKFKVQRVKIQNQYVYGKERKCNLLWIQGAGALL